MGKTCFVCKEKTGFMKNTGIANNFMIAYNLPPVNGMSDDDRICEKCFKKQYSESFTDVMTKPLRTYQETIKQQRIEEKEISEETKQKRKDELKDLMTRGQEYKKDWNKNGIIQFKNERIAILSRMFGSQVEFIVAYDDLTKEGYRLMAIDEGKEGGTGNLMGGVNSYYYFQKMEFVR